MTKVRIHTTKHSKKRVICTNKKIKIKICHHTSTKQQQRFKYSVSRLINFIKNGCLNLLLLLIFIMVITMFFNFILSISVQ